MTSEQIETLLTFLEENPALAKGHLRKLDARVQAARLWDEIVTTLNAMGGAIKTKKQWIKVWTDKKYLAKRVVSGDNQDAGGTGGGPPRFKELTEIEKKIVAIMGPNFGKRVSKARVAAFPKSKRSKTSAQSHRVQTTAVLHNSSPVQNSPAGRPDSSTEQYEMGRGRGRGRLWRPPRTLLAPPLARGTNASSISSRLFQLEEDRVQAEAERAKELHDIRVAIVDLKDTLREAASAQANELREIRMGIASLTDVMRDFMLELIDGRANNK